MFKVFKKFPNKILVHMKTFNKTYIRVLDHLLGAEKHLSVFFSEQSLCMKISHCSLVKKIFHVWKADPHAQLEKHNLQFDPILVHLHSYFGWHTIKLLCSWVGLPHNIFFESHIQILLHVSLYRNYNFGIILKPNYYALGYSSKIY